MHSLPPLPKRCQEHKRDYGAGCPTCLLYGRVRLQRRRKMKAYGRWEGRVSSNPAAVHIHQLFNAGMTVNQIALAAGLPWHAIRDIGNGRRREIYPRTEQCILRTSPGVTFAIGVARRLQALATQGHGSAGIAKTVGVDDRTVDKWRLATSGFISLDHHRAVAKLYDSLLLVPGESRLAAARALGRGWLPPEAWDEETIDDPEARPFDIPAAATYVDWVKVEKARLPKGHPDRVVFTDLAFAEQLELYQEHKSSDRAFIERYRPVPLPTLRRLQKETGRVEEQIAA